MKLASLLYWRTYTRLNNLICKISDWLYELHIKMSEAENENNIDY